jgi:hypothetical protein
MGKFIKFFLLWDINKELSEAVKDEFAFINEDVDFVLKEFFAIIFHIFRHSGTEHHYLFLVRCFDKDLLYV